MTDPSNNNALNAALKAVSEHVFDWQSAVENNNNNNNKTHHYFNFQDGTDNEKDLPVKADKPTLKKTRAKKPDSMPRRPLSAYNIFFREQRERIIDERTQQLKAQQTTNTARRRIKKAKVSLEEMAKIISVLWKNVDPVELQRLKAMAATEADRYKEEMDIYLNGSNQSGRKQYKPRTKCCPKNQESQRLEINNEAMQQNDVSTLSIVTSSSSNSLSPNQHLLLDPTDQDFFMPTLNHQHQEEIKAHEYKRQNTFEDAVAAVSSSGMLYAPNTNTWTPFPAAARNNNSNSKNMPLLDDPFVSLGYFSCAKNDCCIATTTSGFPYIPSSTKVDGCSFSAMQDLQQPQLQQEQQEQLSSPNDMFHHELMSSMENLQQPQLQQQLQQQRSGSGSNDMFHHELMSSMRNLQQPQLQQQLQQQLKCANELFHNEFMTPEPQPIHLQEEISQVDQSSFQNPDVAASFQDIFDDAVVGGGGGGGF